MDNQEKLLKSLVGAWQGVCRTWFQPGELADESTIQGEFKPLLDGRFLRHTYEGAIQGQARSGEETIVFNQTNKKFEVSWFDSFHMNYGLMFSEGQPTENGFSVTGNYDVGSGQPPWGWRTEFTMTDDDNLTITAYNVTPDGQEAKAVETVYKRISN